jgi:hypothetical protein
MTGPPQIGSWGDVLLLVAMCSSMQLFTGGTNLKIGDAETQV